MGHGSDFSIVAERNFMLAAREVGYRTTADAIAELIDNSVQAHAKKIRISIEESPGDNGDLCVAVLDDGHGMDPHTLRIALQFGGTNRFNDRSGQGRFGMGLPSSSISQARRLEVYSWRGPNSVFQCYLDVDEVADGTMRRIPVPRRAQLPGWAASCAAETGTLVMWRKCDRLGAKTASAVAGRLRTQIGRMFRYFIWGGVQISIDGLPVAAIDPLFCHPDTPLSGAKEYGEPLVYNVRLPLDTGRISAIRVRFAELPISEWHDLPVEEKRKYGIVKGAGVSLVRAGREVAYGWHFMGMKRKENYDDWWRCEIRFGPELDEYFRPTYTKQAINPSPELEAVLTPDLEVIARTLNSRARRAYSKAKGRLDGSAASVVSLRDKYLPLMERNGKVETPAERPRKSEGGVFPGNGRKYSLDVASIRQDAFYSVRSNNGTLALILNRDHPFYERIYSPLCAPENKRLRFNMDCLLFALARAESEAKNSDERYWYTRKRLGWSNILAAFLGS